MRTITVSVPNILKPFQFKVSFAALLEPRLEFLVSGNLRIRGRYGSATLPPYKICVMRETTILGIYSCRFVRSRTVYGVGRQSTARVQSAIKCDPLTLLPAGRDLEIAQAGEAGIGLSR